MEKDAKRIPLRIQKKILQLTRVFFAVFILTVLFGVSNCSEAWAKDHWFHHDSCWAQGTSLRCTTCGALLGNAIDQITSTTFYCGDTINVLVGGDSGFTHRFTFHNADYSKMMTPSMYSKGTRYLNHESGRQSRSFGPINTSWSGNWTMYNQFSDTTYYPGKDKGGLLERNYHSTSCLVRLDTNRKSNLYSSRLRVPNLLWLWRKRSPGRCCVRACMVSKNRPRRWVQRSAMQPMRRHYKPDSKYILCCL